LTLDIMFTRRERIVFLPDCKRKSKYLLVTASNVGTQRSGNTRIQFPAHGKTG
jgi:hypothetical protein